MEGYHPTRPLSHSAKRIDSIDVWISNIECSVGGTAAAVTLLLSKREMKLIQVETRSRRKAFKRRYDEIRGGWIGRRV